MSSSHSPHDLLLLLPLQKSSRCNCQYQLKKNNNYYNKTYDSNLVCDNYNSFKNQQSPENILFWILVVPLLISTAPTTTFITRKPTTSPRSVDPSKQVQTSFGPHTSADTSTTTDSKGVSYTKSLALLLRVLTDCLILQAFFKHQNKFRALLLRHEVFNCLQEVAQLLHRTSTVRCYHFFILSTNSASYIPLTKIQKGDSGAAHILTKPEEAFKTKFVFRKNTLKSQESTHKRLFLSIHHVTDSSKAFFKKITIILLITFET